MAAVASWEALLFPMTVDRETKAYKILAESMLGSYEPVEWRLKIEDLRFRDVQMKVDQQTIRRNVIGAGPSVMSAPRLPSDPSGSKRLTRPGMQGTPLQPFSKPLWSTSMVGAHQ